MTTIPSTEFLLDHVSWIRDLAKHLVADESGREDLVQETCVKVLERPPHDANRVRQWLATVMRNLARQRARGEGRRLFREEANAQAESLTPTDELVENATRQRELVRRVLELKEPYRSSLLLRYFEELNPREIASRLDLPIATIHSRLKRALAQLREQLDHGYGGKREAWRALFIPFADVGRTSMPATTLGTLILNTKLAIAILAAIVVGTAISIVTSEPGAPSTPAISSPVVAQVQSSEASQPVAEELGTSVPDPAMREEVLPVTPVAANKPVDPSDVEIAATHDIDGQVLDAFGHPLSGIAVRVDGRNEQATSGIDGHFHIDSSLAECRLIAASIDWVTVHEGFYRKDSFDPVLVVAPSVQLAGEVVAENGEPLAGANVRFKLPEGFDTRFGEILDSTRSSSWSVETDERGRFELFDVPAIECSSMTVLLAGYELGERAAPMQTDRALVITLVRPSKPAEGGLSGRVVDAFGEAVEGARVATGLVSTITDEEGVFHLNLQRAVTPNSVTAVMQGFLPAEMERPFPSDSENAGWPEFVELQLGAPALTLLGRVVKQDGTPMVGARVWLADTRRFGTIGLMPTSLENLMGGARVPPQALESNGNLPDEDGDSYWKRALSGSPSNAVWFWKLTDSNGEFDFEGLFDQGYRVHVLDMESLVEFESEYLNPGPTRERVEVPDRLFYEVVQGIVVDQAERPMKGVRVGLQVEPFDESSRVFGGSSRMVMVVNRETVMTDEHGAFKFKQVPREGVRLTFLSDEIVPNQAWMSEFESNPTSITMSVDARCHVSIELEPGNLANRFEFRDSDGEQLSVHRISEGSHNASTDGLIVDLRSGVVSVSGRATQVILYQGDSQLESIELELWPGEVNVVRSNL